LCVDQWGLFSQGVPGRNGAQCYAFYQRWLQKHGRSAEHSEATKQAESDEESDEAVEEEEDQEEEEEEEDQEEDPHEQEDDDWDEQEMDENLRSPVSRLATSFTRRFSPRLRSQPSTTGPVGIKASLRSRSHAACTRLS